MIARASRISQYREFPLHQSLVWLQPVASQHPAHQNCTPWAIHMSPASSPGSTGFPRGRALPRIVLRSIGTSRVRRHRRSRTRTRFPRGAGCSFGVRSVSGRFDGLRRSRPRDRGPWRARFAHALIVPNQRPNRNVTETTPPPSHRFLSFRYIHRSSYLVVPPVVPLRIGERPRPNEPGRVVPGSDPPVCRTSFGTPPPLSSHVPLHRSGGVAPGRVDPCGKARRPARTMAAAVYAGHGGRNESGGVSLSGPPLRSAVESGR